ncbi:MAG: LVIVD repeat-containing protein [Candidatus Heimdallarchaeota archaeon]
MGLILVVFLTINFVSASGNDLNLKINIEKLSTISTGGAPFDVQVIGNLAYLSDYYDGLSIFDVSNASDPVLLDTYPLNQAHYFHVVGDFAFVACWNYGVRIINISNPTNMSEVGSYNDGSEVACISIDNNVAVVTKPAGGVLFLNVSEPTNPQKLSQYNTTGYLNVCTIRDNIAYIANWNYSDSIVEFINITNPSDPVFIGQYEGLAETYDFHFNGNIMSLANYNSGIHFVNISDPTNPVNVAQFDTQGLAEGVDTNDNYVFVGDTNTLEILECNDFTSIQSIGSFNDEGATQKLQIVDDLVYVSNYPYGLVIFRYTIEDITTSSINLFLFQIPVVFLVLITIIISKNKLKEQIRKKKNKSSFRAYF